MDLRANYFLENMYSIFLERSNVALVIRLIRRRVSKLSLGDFRPADDDEAFKGLTYQMREYLRIHLKYISCSGEPQDILAQFLIEQNKEQEEQFFLDLPRGREQEHCQIVHPHSNIAITCNQEAPAFQERPNFWGGAPGKVNWDGTCSKD